MTDMFRTKASSRYAAWMESHRDGIQERMVDDMIFGQIDDPVPTGLRQAELRESEKRLAEIELRRFEVLTADDPDPDQDKRVNPYAKPLTKDQKEEYEFLRREGHSMQYVADQLGIPLSRVMKHHSRAIVDRKMEATRQKMEDVNGD